MDKKKVIIVDDAENARFALRSILEEHCPEVKVVSEAYDAPSALRKIEQYKPDIVFLDIEMPGVSGVELLKLIREKDIESEVIFATAYSDYAIDAFKFSAIDYVLKPLQIEDIKEAVVKALAKLQTHSFKERYQNLVSQLNGDPVEKIALPVTEGLLFVSIKEILYCKADGAYTRIFLEDGSQLLASKKIGDFEEMLTIERYFFRAHRSFLINLNKIKQFLRADRGVIIMENNDEVDLARDRRNEFFSLIEKIKIG